MRIIIIVMFSTTKVITGGSFLLSFVLGVIGGIHGLARKVWIFKESHRTTLKEKKCILFCLSVSSYLVWGNKLVSKFLEFINYLSM